MKRQYLTYYSLRWSGWVLEGSTSSAGEGIDPPTPWVFPACEAIPVQSLWTLLSLSSSSSDAPEQTCPGSSISFSHRASLMWIQCCSAYHSCLKVQLPQYSRVWSFTYCRCYNVIIWELVMHYTFFIKEHHHLKVKCGKFCASRYILTETVSETSGCGMKTLLLSWTFQNQLYIFPLKGVNIQINRVEYHLTRTCRAIMKPI